MKKSVKEKIVKMMIEQIGDNPDREGVVDTPRRVVNMWEEIFRGYDKKNEPKVTVFENGSDGITVDQMICDTGNFYSHCEHHMVPFFGKYWFCYIPHPKGKVLGLSKVARIVDYYSAKLQVQERLVQEIVEHLWKKLDSKGEAPLAMGLVMEAEHLCKSMRGVKKPGRMRTVKLLGTLKTDTAARAEFMDWVNNDG